MATVAELNDKLRTNPFGGYGRFNVTSGVYSRGPAFLQKCIKAVADFKEFTKDNDPYQERDFGAFIVDEVELYWQISYYDKTLKYGSPNPADPSVTSRVLTILERSEY